MMHKINAVLLCRHLGCHKIEWERPSEREILPTSMALSWRSEFAGVVEAVAATSGDGRCGGRRELPMSYRMTAAW